jgi:hypothetical protein
MPTVRRKEAYYSSHPDPTLLGVVEVFENYFAVRTLKDPSVVALPGVSRILRGVVSAPSIDEGERRLEGRPHFVAGPRPKFLHDRVLLGPKGRREMQG